MSQEYPLFSIKMTPEIVSFWEKKKNAQANLKSNHILYSSGNINICLANLTSHSVINVPIVLQEQTTLEFSFFQCAKKEPFEK